MAGIADVGRGEQATALSRVGARRIIGVEVTLSDWFYNSLIAKEVLTIDREYFRLRKPLERRVYEIARKHCGRQSRPWVISLDKLHLKTGSTAPLKRFRFNIRDLVTSNHLPEYTISFDADKDMVTFRYRSADAAGEQQSELFTDQEPPSVPAQIPPELLEEVRRVLDKGPDYYDLWEQFRGWKGSQNARDMRGAFIGFCKRKAAGIVR